MKRVLNFIKSQSRILIVAVDALVIIASYYLAFVVRHPPEAGYDHFLRTLPIIFALRFAFFIYFRLYKGSWRYASITDLWNIIRAVVASETVFILFMVFVYRLGTYPRGVFVIDAAIAILLLGSMRFSSRLLREFERSFKIDKSARRVLIVGAGDAGEMVAREMLSTTRISSVPIAFVDDKKEKRGQLIHGVPVVGPIGEIPEAVEDLSIDEIIIAIPSASPKLIKRIMVSSEGTRAKVKIVPALRDLIDGKISIAQIREIDIEDLLGREVVNTDIESISKYLRGKRILVTGAGGSIGGEICKQVLRFDPENVMMLDINENTLQDTYTSLVHGSEVELVRIVASITNPRKLRSVFANCRPDIVFHAAACKHVDLMEDNCDEAVITNIAGTKNVIEFAKELYVERVIVISSDKAADPISVMGCTKRVAEMLIQSEPDGGTVVCGVRFGNVLGSQGSVVPLFRRQIEQGGPITITDANMKRYFMTIPEAVELVIQAGAMGKHKDIFMLDMGKPMKIIDLARDMIKLSGFNEEDFEMKFIGMRRGEKLEEVLVGKNETLVNTSHPKILLVQFDNGHVDRQMLNNATEALVKSVIEVDIGRIREILAEIVPEYRDQPVVNKS